MVARADDAPHACEPPLSPPESGLIAAIDRAAARDAAPADTRLRLLARMQFAPTCYPGDLTPEQLDALVASTMLTPPGSRAQFGPRFIADTKSWTGAGQIGDGGTSRAATLTYSFPDDDVVMWGNTCSGYAAGPNNLNVRLAGQFTYTNTCLTPAQQVTINGPFYPHLDRGREFMRSALAAWRSVSGLSYLEVADDNADMDTSPTHPTARGDIRIGGWGFSGSPCSPSGPLAYNGLPSSSLAPCTGGDMTINTNYFTGGYFNNTISGNYLIFRNAIGHEHGHGLGYYHTVPCNLTKLMEPQIHTVVSLLSPDEIRAAIRNYGDRFATIPNHSGANAKDFGNLTTPVLRSVIERDLGVNGNTVVIPTQPVTVLSEEDWFKFTLDSTQNVTISAAPTGYAPIGSCCSPGACAVTTQVNCVSTWNMGGTCSGTTCVAPSTSTSCLGGSTDPRWCQGAQSGGCSGASSLVNAQNAGNLALELRTGLNGVTILGVPANSNTLGVTESIVQSLSAGTYYVKVYDSGGGAGWTSANQTIQTYDLTIRVGTSKAPPFVIAGLQRKRVLANTVCQFIGNHNSYATEAGASLPTGNYAWDLDGDGAFETTAQTQPQFNYVSNGTYNAVLRITDSNGMAASDTTQVVVFGATTSITSVTPSAAATGVTIPITITGANFKGITPATPLSQFAVSGTGVSFSGTPTSNATGTTITGLSLIIAPNAPAGPRNITITNSDGLGTSGTGTGVFTVNGTITTGACCATDGSCTVTESGACSGAFQSVGTTCPPNPCPQPSVACCAPSGACTFVTTLACSGSGNTPLAFGSSCTVNPCPQPTQGCCSTSGSCTFVPAATCSGAGGTPQPFGTPCMPNPCPQPGVACCAASGVCTFVSSATCSGGGGAPQGTGSSCTPNPCPQPNVACCAATGACSFVTAAACSGAGDVPQAFGSTCEPNPCPQPTGACCNGAVCSVGPMLSCVAANTRFLGAGSACNSPGNRTAPCCMADFNQDSTLAVEDIFDFLNAWFAGSASADINGGGLAVQDIFDYLNAWFSGC